MSAAGTPTIVGVFEDDAAARDAVHRLQASGVGSGAISVARGPAAPPPEDTPAMSRVFWSGFWWSVAGAGVGVALGFVFGTLGGGVLETPGGIWIQIVAWGMFAHVAGAIVGCYLALDTGDRFSTNAAHHDSPETLVRVRVEGELEARQLEGVLREAGARETQRGAGGTSSQASA